MRRLIPVAAIALLSVACQTRSFRGVPDADNRIPAGPLRLTAGATEVLLADCLPGWTYADSVTVWGAPLDVQALAGDWSRFRVTASEGALVGALDLWREGCKLSVPVVCGSTDDCVRMFSDGAMLKVVSVRCNREPKRIVALWQNCRLPESDIVEIDGAFGVIVPKDARSMERSWLRVYASTDSVLFNDVLIPLDRGRIVKSPRQLTCGDRHAQTVYARCCDGIGAGVSSGCDPAGCGRFLPAIRTDMPCDYNLFHAAVRVFMHEDSIGLIARAVSRAGAEYGAHHMLCNPGGQFSAFTNTSCPEQAGAGAPADGGVDYQKLALFDALVMTVPGLPCMTADGTRCGASAEAPDNLPPMRLGGDAPGLREYRARVARLAALRRTQLPLLYGDLLSLGGTGHTWAFARIYMGQYVVVAFNSTTRSRDLLVELPRGLKTYPLRTNFGGELRTSDDGRRIAVVLPPYGFEVLTRAAKHGGGNGN